MTTALPPRYGSSAEESSPKPSETDEKPKKTQKKRKTTKKKGGDDDLAPLNPGKRDDDEDEGSDDLEGLDQLLELGEDGPPKKRPASKSSTGSKKRPSTSKRSKKKDHDLLCYIYIMDITYKRTIFRLFLLWVFCATGCFPLQDMVPFELEIEGGGDNEVVLDPPCDADAPLDVDSPGNATEFLDTIEKQTYQKIRFIDSMVPHSTPLVPSLL